MSAGGYDVPHNPSGFSRFEPRRLSGPMQASYDVRIVMMVLAFLNISNTSNSIPEVTKPRFAQKNTFTTHRLGSQALR